MAMQQRAAATVVPADWSLIPAGLAPGDQFRLLFLSSTKRDGASSDIATYNTFIQNRAATGHADIQAYSSGFRALGCTAASDARDNTGTTYTGADKGISIYWLRGSRVAVDYEDFYDGSWDDEANGKNESGANGPNTSQSTNYPVTVTVGDSGDSAVEGTDYETIGELTLNIPVGQTSTFQTVQFRPINDGTGEGGRSD